MLSILRSSSLVANGIHYLLMLTQVVLNWYMCMCVHMHVIFFFFFSVLEISFHMDPYFDCKNNL